MFPPFSLLSKVIQKLRKTQDSEVILHVYDIRPTVQLHISYRIYLLMTDNNVNQAYKIQPNSNLSLQVISS